MLCYFHTLCYLELIAFLKNIFRYVFLQFSQPSYRHKARYCTSVLICIVAVQTVSFIRQQSPPDVFRESLLVSDSMSSRIFLGYRFAVDTHTISFYLSSLLFWIYSMSGQLPEKRNFGNGCNMFCTVCPSSSPSTGITALSGTSTQ